VVIDIVHQLLNFLLIPHLTDETTPSSPVSNYYCWQRFNH